MRMISLEDILNEEFHLVICNGTSIPLESIIFGDILRRGINSISDAGAYLNACEAKSVVCADGGANTLKAFLAFKHEHGCPGGATRFPDAIFGDLDSIDEESLKFFSEKVPAQ